MRGHQSPPQSAKMSVGRIVVWEAPGASEMTDRAERGWAGEPTDDVWSLLEDFAATIAHELRTPLAVVETAAETVLERRDELEPDQLAEMLRSIQRNSKLATLLLGRLGLAREVEAGNVALWPEQVDLVAITGETLSDLNDVLLRDHPTEIHADGPLTIEADATAIREIVFNLLSNAAKYSDPGARIEVAVERHSEEVQVIVRNHGSGVTPGDTDRIFGKYERADPRGHGVGLGLYISRGLARAHGGDLQVRPAAREGSEFVLSLPVAIPEHASSRTQDDGPS